MELRLDTKTLAIGILTGVIITIALGVDGARDSETGRLVDTSKFAATADKTDYGLSINSNGMVMVRTNNGDFFIVNPESGMAVRVLHTRRISEDAEVKRDGRGRQFNFFTTGPTEEPSQGQGYGN